MCVCVWWGGGGKERGRMSGKGRRGEKKNSEQQFRVRYEIAGEDGE